MHITARLHLGRGWAGVRTTAPSGELVKGTRCQEVARSWALGAANLESGPIVDFKSLVAERSGGPPLMNDIEGASLGTDGAKKRPSLSHIWKLRPRSGLRLAPGRELDWPA